MPVGSRAALEAERGVAAVPLGVVLCCRRSNGVVVGRELLLHVAVQELVHDAAQAAQVHGARLRHIQHQLYGKWKGKEWLCHAKVRLLACGGAAATCSLRNKAKKKPSKAETTTAATRGETVARLDEVIEGAVGAPQRWLCRTQ